MRIRRAEGPGGRHGKVREQKGRASPEFTIPRARILLALKTALAVSLSWAVAQRMPGILDEYPYYAPLGAITAMYPTILGSVRGSLQTVVGLSLGVLLAAGVLAFGEPTLITIGAAVGIGVLLSGMRRLGEGAHYVPIAAVFVLIIGGHQPLTYSVSYLTQMAIGVLIGTVVNVAVVPPLDFRTARLQLDRLQGVVVDFLGDLADDLEKPGTIGLRNRDRRSRELFRIADEVREAVEDSADSARGNPRVVLRRSVRGSDPGYRPLETLEWVVFHLRDLTDVLRAVYDPRDERWTVAEPITAGLADALRGTSATVRAWAEEEDVAEAADRVRSTIGELHDKVAELSGSEHRQLVTVVADLERLVNVIDPPPPPTGSTSVVAAD